MLSTDCPATLPALQAALAAEQWPESRQLAERLLEQARAADDCVCEIHAHIGLAHVAQRQGAHSRAAAHAASALTLSQGLDEPLLLARCRLASARAAWGVGEHNQALTELEIALPVSQESGDPDLHFDTLNLLGIVSGELALSEAALDWHQRALDLAEGQGSARMRAVAHANLAGRELDLGESLQRDGLPTEARAALERSLAFCDTTLAIAAQTGLRHVRQAALCNRGAALALLGRRAEAQQAFDAQLALAQDGDDTAGQVQRAHYLARMHRDAGDLTAARGIAAQGLTLGEQSLAGSQLVPLYELASALAEQDGDLGQALALYKRYHLLRSELLLSEARQRAQAQAVRQDTERTLAEMAAQRLQAHALSLANDELARRAEALGRDALQDALTGLANRRCLDAHLGRRFESARRRSAPLCVALIDLDHFKLINDHHSHAVGDRVLSQFGALLQTHCRGQDLAARYGGEEFLIVLDDVDLLAAWQICERLRQAIVQHDWQALVPGLRVSASLGLADISSHPSLDQGLAEADRLLYAAKQTGRNRVRGPVGFVPPAAA